MISWRIETHDTISSTQDLIKTYAEDNQPEGIVVQARAQTGGRGRHGRVWVSEPGNLYLSFLLRPNCSAQKIGQLSILIGAALGETIQDQLKNPGDLTLKWPNDVLIDGKKCAGILIETGLNPNGSIAWAAIGIGVNIAAAPANLGAALNDYIYKPLDAAAFRDQFLENINKFYGLWPGDFAQIREQWLALAHPKGADLQVKIGEQPEKGVFDGLDDDGNLLLLTASGQRKKVTAGEVYLINSVS